jgi:hypothetical protein
VIEVLGIDNERFQLYHYVRDEYVNDNEEGQKMEKTWKPVAGGVLAIIAGALGVIIGVLFATGVGLLGGIFGMGWLSAIFAPLIVFGIIAIVGGVCSLQRRIWGLALAGSICALIGPWFLLGILAIIFVSLGKREFK